jgi:hypothetical protein
MNCRLLLTVAVAGASLVACSSGDINIAPATTVTDSNNTTVGGGGSENDDCASYTNSGGQVIQGQVDGNGNCVYSPAFAIVKHIVVLHDGTVSVDSEPGKGSVFHIDIPKTGASGEMGQDIPCNSNRR